MADNWNWDELEKRAGGTFAPMSDAGIFKVPVETVDIRESHNAQGNTTYWLDFLFTEGKTRFPKISHAVSFKNQGWRMVHFKRILVELGIPEDKARQGIEQAEKKSGNANIAATYHALFERATAKHPEIEIEVFEDTALNPNTGKPYMRADFKNPAISFARGDKKPATTNAGTILDEGESVDLTDLPFTYPAHASEWHPLPPTIIKT